MTVKVTNQEFRLIRLATLLATGVPAPFMKVIQTAYDAELRAWQIEQEFAQDINIGLSGEEEKLALATISKGL